MELVNSTIARCLILVDLWQQRTYNPRFFISS